MNHIEACGVYFEVPRLGSRGKCMKVSDTGGCREKAGVTWLLDAEWDQVWPET